MTTLGSSREIPAAPEEVFAAFSPDRLARWWGPAGFTNSLHLGRLSIGGASAIFQRPFVAKARRESETSLGR
jgi:uncharacterized protein YndB with AHSA1/START domain